MDLGIFSVVSIYWFFISLMTWGMIHHEGSTNKPLLLSLKISTAIPAIALLIIYFTMAVKLVLGG